MWGWGLCVGLGLRVGIEVMGMGVMGIRVMGLGAGGR